MGSVELLDKTRRIGRLLHEVNEGKVVFNDICRLLSDTLSSDILVVSRKGKLLGIGEAGHVNGVDFEILPLKSRQRRADRHLALIFFGLEVKDARALVDVAEAGRRAAVEKCRFKQRGLARAAVSAECYISDAFAFVVFHV